MAHPRLIGSPKALLYMGSHTYTLEDKRRVFCVRQVDFDESGNPLYSTPRINEERYESLVKLYNDYPLLQDIDILDNEHRLQTWKEN
jgi:hypothetical protein